MVLLPGVGVGSDAAAITERVDWPSVLASSNPSLTGLVSRWDQQPFTGNGREGMLIGCTATGLEFRLGRSDVVDRRDSGDTTQFRPCFDAARLPIGRLVITSPIIADPKRKVTAGIDLWHAEATGKILSGNGELTWRAWTPMGAAVNVIDITVTSGDLPTVTFQADPAIGGRNKKPPAGYAAHPAAIAGTDGDIALSVQDFPGGGGYTVAWATTSSANRLVVVSAIGFDRNAASHRAEAIAAVRAVTDVEALRVRHHAAWATWWQRSAIVVPDAMAQRFYWLQLYKLGSAIRADGPMLDLMGPWWGSGPWPAIWWNLNVQLSYQLCAPANRIELLDSLVDTIIRGADAMGASVPAAWGGPQAIAVGRISSYDGRSHIHEGAEAGNLTWALAVAWDGYRLSGDRARAERLLPIMARAAAFHLARAKPGADGKLHLPVSGSPESGAAADCSYEIGPMRWLLRTLVEAERDVGWKHPDQARWRTALTTLTPLAADEQGWLTGNGKAVSLGHRHWSHLIHVYPLRDFDAENQTERDLARRSVETWTGNTKLWRGYSRMGAASMWSLLGEPDQVEKFLLPGIKGLAGGNTLYREEGPCIETPLQAAATLQEALLTWDRRGLRIFAGTPSAWKDAAFHRLRAPIGLSVSAQRRAGTTDWVRIEAAVGQVVRVEARFATKPEVRATAPPMLNDIGNGWYEFPLAAGQAVLLCTPGFAAPVEMTMPMPSRQNP